MNEEDGVEKFVAFIDRVLMGNSLEREIWKKVAEFEREEGAELETYIEEYEKLFNEAEDRKLKYPESLKSFRMLKGDYQVHSLLNDYR